jgi:AAA15 family ATPase/GTPase
VALSSISLGNFKSFADSGKILLAPLTVIFGRNNTGKSSILQSLLVLKQSFDSPEYGARLNLRGPLYAAGSFADIIHQHRVKQSLTFELSFTAEGEAPGRMELEFASDEPRAPRLAKP